MTRVLGWLWAVLLAVVGVVVDLGTMVLLSALVLLVLLVGGAAFTLIIYLAATHLGLPI